MEYICDDCRISSEEFARGSSSLAEYITRNNFNKVLIYGHKSPLVPLSIQACIKSGTTYIPVDMFISEERLRSVISQSEPDVIFCTEGEIPSDIERVSASALIEIIHEPSDFKNISVPLNNTSYIIFTSGSTGIPKKIEITRKNLANFICWFNEIPAVRECRPLTVLNQAAFSFDLSVADLFYSLNSGARLYALSREDTENFTRLFKKLSASEAEMAVITPSFAELCLCDRGFCSELMPSLEVIFFCGETLKPTTAKKIFTRFPGIRIVNAYGPSEATCAVTCIEITPEMTECERLPVGEIYTSAVDISVCNGEIVLCGDSVGKNLDEHYHTGDCGYIKDGLLYFTGRNDAQIKYKGYRIEPSDIENNLCKLDGITSAAVIPNKKDNREVISLTAYVVCSDGSSDFEIKEALKRYVPPYMIPKTIIVTEKLPVSNNFKRDRAALCSGEIL